MISFQDEKNTQTLDIMELSGTHVYAILFTIENTAGDKRSVLRELEMIENVWDVVLEFNRKCTEACANGNNLWVADTQYIARGTHNVKTVEETIKKLKS